MGHAQFGKSEYIGGGLLGLTNRAENKPAEAARDFAQRQDIVPLVRKPIPRGQGRVVQQAGVSGLGALTPAATDAGEKLVGEVLLASMFVGAAYLAYKLIIRG